jgi:hypothetical protein
MEKCRYAILIVGAILTAPTVYRTSRLYLLFQWPLGSFPAYKKNLGLLPELVSKTINVQSLTKYFPVHTYYVIANNNYSAQRSNCYSMYSWRNKNCFWLSHTPEAKIFCKQAVYRYTQHIFTSQTVFLYARAVGSICAQSLLVK